MNFNNDLTLEQAMFIHVRDVYFANRMNKIVTAKILGIGRATLYRYLDRMRTQGIIK